MGNDPLGILTPKKENGTQSDPLGILTPVEKKSEVESTNGTPPLESTESSSNPPSSLLGNDIAPKGALDNVGGELKVTTTPQEQKEVLKKQIESHPLYQQGAFNQQKFVEENPSIVGNGYLQSGDNNSAVKQFSLALQKNPDDIVAIQGMADAAKNNGDDNTALLFYQQGADKGYVSSMMNLASLQYDLSKKQPDKKMQFLNSALQNVDAVLQNDSEDALANLTKGKILTSLGKDGSEYQQKGFAGIDKEFHPDKIGYGDVFKKVGENIGNAVGTAVAAGVDVPSFMNKVYEMGAGGLDEVKSGWENGLEAIKKGDAQGLLNADLQSIGGSLSVAFSGLSATPQGYVFLQGLDAGDKLTNGQASKLIMSPLTSFTPQGSETAQRFKGMGDLVISMIGLHALHLATQGKTVEAKQIQDANEKLKSGEGLNGEETKTLAQVVPQLKPDELKQVLNKIPADVPTETKLNIAPKIEEKDILNKKKEELEKQKGNVDDVFHPKLDEQISEIDAQIKNKDGEIVAILDQSKKSEPIDLPTETKTETPQTEAVRTTEEIQADIDNVQELLDLSGGKSETVKGELEKLQEELSKVVKTEDVKTETAPIPEPPTVDEGKQLDVVGSGEVIKKSNLNPDSALADDVKKVGEYVEVEFNPREINVGETPDVKKEIKKGSNVSELPNVIVDDIIKGQIHILDGSNRVKYARNENQTIKAFIPKEKLDEFNALKNKGEKFDTPPEKTQRTNEPFLTDKKSQSGAVVNLESPKTEVKSAPLQKEGKGKEVKPQKPIVVEKEIPKTKTEKQLPEKPKIKDYQEYLGKDLNKTEVGKLTTQEAKNRLQSIADLFARVDKQLKKEGITPMRNAELQMIKATYLKGAELLQDKIAKDERKVERDKKVDEVFDKVGKVLKGTSIDALKKKGINIKKSGLDIDLLLNEARDLTKKFLDEAADLPEITDKIKYAIDKALEAITKIKLYKSLVEKGAFTHEEFSKSLSEGAKEFGKKEPNMVGASHRALTDLANRLGLKEPERGEYLDPQVYADRGRKLLDAGADPNEVNNPNNELHDRISIARAHLEDLKKQADAVGLEKGFDSNEYRDALKPVEDYANDVVKKLGTAAHRAMVSLQGDRDISTESFTSVRQAVKDDLGKEPSKEQDAKIKELTEQNQKLKEQSDALEKKLIEATSKSIEEEKPTRKQQAKVKLDAARLAFRKAAGLSSGGLEALPEFINLIAAYAEYGFESAKEAWAQFQKDFPKANIKQADFEKKYNEQAAQLSKGTDLEKLQQQFLGKKGSKFTTDEAKSIWDYAKKTYIDNGYSYRDMIGAVANDIGLSWKQVSQALTSPKTKPISDAMWKKQSDYRRNQSATKNWVEQQNKSIYMKALRKVSGAFRGVSVFGHGGIFVGTHAGMTFFSPSQWKYTLPAFFRGWKFAYGDKAAYEMRMEELKNSPNYVIAQRAGLKNNPDNIKAEEFQNSQKFLGKLGLAGERGFNAIKILRQDLFDYHYDRLTDAEKQDPQAVQQIARLINNATGATNLKLPEWVNEATFAGGMEAARWGKLTRNPARATAIAIKALVKPNETTAAEKVFAKVWARRVGEQVGTMAALLTVNAIIQNMVNPKNPTNLTNPNKSDFLKFKFGDVTIDPTSGMRGAALFIYGLGKIPFMNKQDLRGDTRIQYLGKSSFGYGRGKLAPLYSTLADLYAQQDFNRNPLPFSNEKPEAGKHKLSWLEYGWEKAPLPIAHAAEDMYHSALDNGGSKLQVSNILEGIISGGLSGATGFRVGEYDAETANHSPFTDEDKKDTTFKYFTDKGLELPNTSLSSEEITDEVNGTKKKISDYPKEIQDTYQNTHKQELKSELDKIKTKGTVYVKTYTDAQGNKTSSVSINKPDTGTYKVVSLDKLSKEELAQVLSIAQSQATKKAKDKIFYNTSSNSTEEETGGAEVIESEGETVVSE